jgi:hypothetical protein
MLNMSVSGKSIAMAVPIDDGKVAIDLYDIDDGAYRESLAIPESVTRAYMSGNTVFTTTRNTVSVWKVQPPVTLSGRLQ